MVLRYLLQLTHNLPLRTENKYKESSLESAKPYKPSPLNIFDQKHFGEDLSLTDVKPAKILPRGKNASQSK